MSKINIDNELCNYIDANDGQVTLGGLAEHFAEYGCQYAIDKACEWLRAHLGAPAGIPQAKSYNDAINELTTEFRKGMYNG